MGSRMRSSLRVRARGGWFRLVRVLGGTGGCRFGGGTVRRKLKGQPVQGSLGRYTQPLHREHRMPSRLTNC